MLVDPFDFDPNSTQEAVADNGFSQTIPNCHPDFLMETELQHQLGSSNGTHLDHHSNWDNEIQNNLHNFETQNGHNHNQNQNQILNSSLPNTPYPPTPDLLSLFHLSSRASSLPNSSISFSNPNHRSENFQDDLYDPLLHLNLPPQPPSFRDLLQSLPHGYNNNSLFGGVDEREGSGGLFYQDGDGRQFDDGVLEFNRDMNGIIDDGRGGIDNTPKHFATERQRRVHLNDKYKALRCLVPNPTKPDRASIVGDAIEYIKELLRTVNELKILVEKKRYGREKRKRHENKDKNAPGDVENANMEPDQDKSYNGNSTMRTSWLQRKSKETEVDVRIIHDEMNIKLVQRKINCLVLVCKVLDDLQLDLHHVAGGHIGDYYSFLFNTKICEGSCVYASAIANKLIEVVDRQCTTTPSTSDY